MKIKLGHDRYTPLKPIGEARCGDGVNVIACEDGTIVIVNIQDIAILRLNIKTLQRVHDAACRLLRGDDVDEEEGP